MSNHIFYKTKGEDKLEIPSIKDIKKTQQQFKFQSAQEYHDDLMMLDANDSLEKKIIESKIEEIQKHNEKLLQRLVVNISE